MLLNNNKHNLTGLEVTGKKAIYYPPILDKDPILAARFLSIEDSIKYFELLVKAFNNIKNGKEEYTVLEKSITFSPLNFRWFASFTTELGNLMETEEDVIIPFECSPEIAAHNLLVLQPPITLTSKKTIKYKKFGIKTIDPVDLHRIEYIGKDLEVSDFKEGLPAWYIITQQTVYEKYNSKTNTRVKIDFRNGEFFYFISGASDNWKQIQDVPLEMDHVVSALLFRN